jgi:hypothetical protein
VIVSWAIAGAAAYKSAATATESLTGPLDFTSFSLLLPAFFDLLRETLAQGHDASQRHLVSRGFGVARITSFVVPAKAGTHNQRRWLSIKPSDIVPRAQPQRMGSGFAPGRQGCRSPGRNPAFSLAPSARDHANIFRPQKRAWGMPGAGSHPQPRVGKIKTTRA